MNLRGWLLLLCTLSAALGGRSETLFGLNDTSWKFLKGMSEASSPEVAAWLQPAFDDTAWLDARASIYYTLSPAEPPFWDGGAVTGTILDDMYDGYTCVFFRKSFVITNVAALGSITVQIASDDGFILWLNGVEVARDNVPAGFVPFNGKALVSVTEPVSIFTFSLPNPGVWLRNGSNVLAAQGFNWDPGSSDFGFMAGLFIEPITAPPDGCTTPVAGPAAWWPFEGNGDDIAGGAGLSLIGGPTFAGGKVNQGLALDGLNDYGKAPASSGLNLGSASGMTIEAWINPADATRLTDIVEWNNGAGGIGVHLSTSTASSRDFYANLVDTTGTSHQIYSGTGLLQSQVFQHIALTYDKMSGAAALYWNGTQVASTNLGTFTAQTSYDFYVGTRASGPFQGIWFGGGMDELSLYTRVLSAAEVRSIFAAGAAGKCTAPRPLAIVTDPQSAMTSLNGTASFLVLAQGAAPLYYQWLFNGGSIAGAVQPALTLTNVQPQQAGKYSVIVSDISGSVTSAPAVLTVLVPLSIVTPPQSLMTVAGGFANFSVIAQATGALSYQWFFNGAPLSGATGTDLTLQDVQANQAGRYSVSVTTGSQSITGAPAVLTVLPAWTPVITEFMAENDGSLLDEDGDSSDWIEIFNPGPDAVDFRNWCLTDDPANLTKWRFPATNLAANAYLLIFSSGKNRTIPGAPLHTNFQLDHAGGYLALVRPDGVTIASEFAPSYPAQRADVSYGLSGGQVYFPTPTPGAANELGVLGFVADTKFSTNRGFFFAAFDVTLNSASAGATLVYTTNGDVPTLTTGMVVPPLNATSAPSVTVHISDTTNLRAAAFKDGYVPTGVDTHSYIFPSRVANQTRPTGASTTWVDDPPATSGIFPADFTLDASVINNTLPGYSFTNALLAVPTISIVTPLAGLFGSATGIYTHAYLMGTDWERPASVELIYPDGREGFHQQAGLRTHGAVSRLNAATPKHPLRLTFRSEYGAAKLEFPLFPGSPVSRFDHLVLRACSTDAWAIQNIIDFLWRNYDATYQRDQWMRDAQLDMGHVSPRGIYVQLYLNGLYWGLYNVTERLGDSFCAEHLGGDKTEYDVVTDFDGDAVAGDRAAWTQLLQLSDRAAADSAVFWQIQGLNPDGARNTNFPVLINLDNFIDYMALHIYAAAIDWPGRNWWAARRRGLESDGFHFFVWDQEIAIDRLDRVGTWGNAPANIEEVYEPNTVGQVYNGLRRDAEFKLRFADRLQKHLFNGGALTVEANRARWGARAAEIDHAIVGESARWGDAHHSPAFTRETDWLRLSSFTQNVYWPSNVTRAWQRFRNVGLYPSVGAPIFNQFGGTVPAGFQVVLSQTNVTGTIYYTLDGTDPRLIGGAIASGAQIYSQPLALVSPTQIRARVLSAGTWSAIAEAQFFTPQDFSRLQVSEIMYNPTKLGIVDGEEFEFLELRNIGAATLDLSGLTFTDGIDFTFPNETLLAPGGFFVLARNAVQFGVRYPNVQIDGIYTGKLNNGGETITLSHPLVGTIFSITYGDSPPWPTGADGFGFSLQRVNNALDANAPNNWTAALPTPGAPLPLELMDTDGDGIPDVWELAHHTDPNAADANDDPDQDGMNNLEEYLAGTDPQDKESFLKLEAAGARITGTNLFVVLQFQAVANKTYTVLERESAVEGSWAALVSFPAEQTGRQISVTNIISVEAPSRFYRLRTPRLP